MALSGTGEPLDGRAGSDGGAASGSGPKLIPCPCGGSDFRAELAIPVAVQAGPDEMTLEVGPVYVEWISDFQLECLECGASTDAPEMGEAKEALQHAQAAIEDALAGSMVMTELCESCTRFDTSAAPKFPHGDIPWDEFPWEEHS